MLPSRMSLFIALLAFVCNCAVSLGNDASLTQPPTKDGDKSRQLLAVNNVYYDWLLTEYSFKFWNYFMLIAMALLAYAAVASTYYSKINAIFPSPEYEYDYFLGRKKRFASESSSGLLSLNTMMRIFEAIEGPLNVVPGS
ncbi:hypothetical protein J437_LFUL012490 [Ladona fulva]|uniref:Uncharacterized protein n=1 Tax=Ladona fulva TaxID=123851 RepID=A0A8K0KFC6_LADFU|nr:hypothetical protein J437_LFUL012490 [Ladona fulva]